METIRERIMSKVEISPKGCWIFTRALTSRGYGSLNVGGTARSTHVLMYVAAGHVIPEGMELDHLCRVRACCNPDHLEAVPQRVNWERGQSPSRINSLRTHCKHGHALTGDNVRVVTRRGRNESRQCVTCQRDRNRAHMRVARAA